MTAREYPSGPHPKNPKMSTAEIVLTTLHAGGKFGGKGYQVSGGLHGVGHFSGECAVDPVDPRDRPGRSALGSRIRKGREGKTQDRRHRPFADRPVDRRAAHGNNGHVLAGRVDPGRNRVPGPDHHRADADHGLFEQRPGDPFHRRAGDTRGEDHVQIRRRDRRLRQASQRGQRVTVPQGGGFRGGRRRPRGRNRHAVEHGVPRVDLLVRQRHFDRRGRHARRRVSHGPDEHREPVRPGAQSSQGERGQPSGRGHPGRSHGHHLRAFAGPAVRRADQIEVGQPVHPLTGGEGHQQETERMAGGKPQRGQSNRGEGHAGGARAHGSTGRPGPHPAQVRAGRSGPARKALGLLLPRPPGIRALHRRRQLGRWIGEGRPRPAHPGDPAHPGKDPQRRAGPH